MEDPMAQAPLGALRVFEAVARHGSFSRAADELCVTQSAVSHQVRGLEAWFGAPLFERSGNRATLLPHAERLAQALSRALEDIELACRQARRAGGPPGSRASGPRRRRGSARSITPRRTPTSAASSPTSRSTARRRAG
jgi:DNA-binding transcriptional LysR family regulator